jgi:hypothetical protein
LAVEIDVVIPSLRPQTVTAALASLSLGSRRPDLVTIVSNEIGRDVDCHGLAVRVLRFRSAIYPVGSQDVALRRNVGIWSSPCSHLITFDDDQIAPADMAASAAALLEQSPYFWGHYRYLRFDGLTVEQIVRLPPEAGRAREHPPNAWHLWQSAYGGLFGASKDLLLEVGGYDMAFCGRHAGEDQDLARRLARRVYGSERIFVHEPPFAWHPEERIAWGEPGWSNLCTDGHELAAARVGGLPAQRCGRCPYFQLTGPVGGNGRLIIPFDPDSVEIVVEALS